MQPDEFTEVGWISTFPGLYEVPENVIQAKLATLYAINGFLIPQFERIRVLKKNSSAPLTAGDALFVEDSKGQIPLINGCYYFMPSPLGVGTHEMGVGKPVPSKYLIISGGVYASTGTVNPPVMTTHAARTRLSTTTVAP